MAEHTPRDKSENGATGVQPPVRRKTGTHTQNQGNSGKALSPGDREKEYSKHNSSTSLSF